MANKIYVDTQLLEDLGEQIRQLQRSLDSVNGEITRSLSEVRRVASSQDQLIRKMQTVGQNTRKTSDHAGKLANAVIYAAKLWEEAEKKISQRAITDGSAIAEGEVVAAGGPTPTQKPDWFSSILDWFKRNYDSFTNRNDAQLQISLMGQMLYHLIRQEPFSSGSINEFKFQPEGGFSLFGNEFSGGTEWAAWNNDFIGVTQQEVDIFGHKVKMYLPYINYGMGASMQALTGSVETSDNHYAEGTVGDGYIGSKFEIGFKDGKFVFHLGGGASISALSGGAGVKGEYGSVVISGDVKSAGGKFSLDYRDGVISVDGLAALGLGVDGNATLNIGQYLSDVGDVVSDVSHGDFIPAFEKVYNIADNLSIFSPI